MIECVNSTPDESKTTDPDEASILSESRNLTVYSNETVHLPCLVRKAPNTIVIWNQCEDPICNHLRNPITINKDNFIEDLRFRVLSDLQVTTTTSANDVDSDPLTVKRDQDAAVRDEKTGEEALEPGVSAWNLEIRRFNKLDEGCYQCQLNSYRVKTIHYCLKLQSNFRIFQPFNIRAGYKFESLARVIARPRKLTARVNNPIRLKCSTDENVRLSNIKWFRNGHRIVDEAAANEFLIEKKVHNDHIFTTLLIKHATPNDAGIYMCKFGLVSEKIHVDVVVGDEKIKSAGKFIVS